MDSLVSTEWLAQHLGEAGLVVLDASAHLPDAKRDPRAEFAAGHIPGARFLDIPSLVDPDSPVPSAVPTGAQFAARMQSLGVNAGDRLVIYDDSAVKTSARAWFIARMNGAKDVAILDGGLGKWRAEGRPIEGGEPTVERGDFTAVPGSGIAPRAIGEVRAQSAATASALPANHPPERRRPVAKLRGVNKGGLTYSVIGARFALAAGGNGAEEIAVPTSG